MEQIKKDALGYAERIGGEKFGKVTEVFKFEKIKRAKRKAAADHPEMSLLDMGVGEPDQPADPSIQQVLKEETKKASNRFYADNGILEYRQAAAEYLESVYQVEGLDQQTQICHGIGSKSILAILPMAFIDPGDITLLTVPGYPIMGTMTKYLGGEVYELPLRPENGYLPELTTIPKEVLRKAKLWYLNYPNNPTGAVADYQFYEQVVALAKEYNIVVVNDAAYGAIVYEGRQPFSFLTVHGALEIGAEIHSMSKAFSMTGWRLGFLAGNQAIIHAFATVKDNMDSGQFHAIQVAGAYALRHPEITKVQVARYERRMRLLVKTLREVGFHAEMAPGSFYCYVPAPKAAVRDFHTRVTFTSAEEAATYLIEEALVSTVPWTEAGDYLRFSITYESGNQTDEAIIQELKRRLCKMQLTFC